MADFCKRLEVLASAANTILSKLKKSDLYLAQISFDAKLSSDESVVFVAPNALIANFINTKYGELLAGEFEASINKRKQCSNYSA